MASLGRKFFFGIITVLLGVFAVFPLFVFAVFTFWIAICFLVFLVLFKGIGAIWRSLLQWRNSDGTNSPEAIARRERLADQARSLARAQSASASQSSNTPTRSQFNRSYRSNSNVSLASLPQPDRDYEGVGGWLINPQANNTFNSNNPFDDADNSSQISVPNPSTTSDVSPPAFRRRSFGAASTGINSPEILNTPSHYRHSTMSALYGRPVPSPMSPQSSSTNVTAGRSTSASSRRNSRVTMLMNTEETPSDVENVSG